MKLNIIIPHYNRVEKCIKLLDSIYKEATPEQLNVLVIDDASTVDISELKLYLEQHAAVLRSNVYGKGAGGARNTGLDYLDLEAPFTLFADSDDLLTEGWFEAVNKALLERKNRDIYYFKNSGENLLLRNDSHDFFYDRQNEKEKCLDLLFRDVVPWAKAFRTAFLVDNAEIKFDETLRANDVNFIIRAVIRADSISISKDSIYEYTLDGDNISRQHLEKWEDSVDVYHRKGDLIHAYLKDKKLHYRVSCMYLINEARACEFGLVKIMSVILGIWKHHMRIFPGLETFKFVYWARKRQR